MQYSANICHVNRQKRSDPAASINLLLLSDNPSHVAKVRSAIRGTVGKFTCIATVEAVLRSLSDDHFDLIIVDRHLGGWLTPQACRAVVAKAQPIPVVGLINANCVLDLRDGIEAGLIAVYYRDQIDAPSMRRLSGYAD